MKEVEPELTTGKTKIISFAGIDKYDYILLLAQILLNLRYKVLVIDLSENAALSDALYEVKDDYETEESPMILNHKQLEFIPKVEDACYRGDFFNPYLYKLNEDYDFILVDYGFDVLKDSIKKSDELVIVTDMQKHNMNHLSSLFEQKELNTDIILEQVVKCKIQGESLMREVPLDNCCIFYMPLCTKDTKNRILMQYTRVYTGYQPSHQMKKLLLHLTHRVVHRSDQEIIRALSDAIRGK